MFLGVNMLTFAGNESTCAVIDIHTTSQDHADEQLNIFSAMAAAISQDQCRIRADFAATLEGIRLTAHFDFDCCAEKWIFQMKCQLKGILC